MKIGIISDLHGYPEILKRALFILDDCDLILCAGDIIYHGPRNPILKGYNPLGIVDTIKNSKVPILFVRGNCDCDVDEMVLEIPVILPMVFYEAEGVKFMVLHGHNVDEKRLREIAEYYHVDILITGHTHIRKFEKEQNAIFVNPGSISLPKGDGIPSLAVYEKGEVSFINVDDGSVIEKTRVEL